MKIQSELDILHSIKDVLLKEFVVYVSQCIVDVHYAVGFDTKLVNVPFELVAYLLRALRYL